MTTIERIDKENRNTSNLILYAEGIFYKAYERSAYVFHTRINAFRLKVKTLKDLEHPFLTLGFPMTQKEKYLKGLEIVEENAEYLIAKLPEPIDLEDFKAWKTFFVNDTNDKGCEKDETLVKDKRDNVNVPVADENSKILKEYMKKVLALNMTAMTPMDAFNFLYQLQNNLRNVNQTM